MKINSILKKFLQVLIITGSSIFTAKASHVDASSATNENKTTIADRINLVREHIRNKAGKNVLAENSENFRRISPGDQIWINIAPWSDWNKAWNDWANWNDWHNWNNWANFHRDFDFDHDRGHGHDHDRGRDHDHDRGGDHGHGRR